MWMDGQTYRMFPLYLNLVQILSRVYVHVEGVGCERGLRFEILPESSEHMR
jgi:hypothetical protein